VVEKLESWGPVNSLIAQEISMSKLAGSHTTIYSANGVPLFFDVDGRGVLLPTVC
jgi:hypothetical protein